MGVETKIDYPFSVDTWTKNSERKPFHFLTHAHKDHTEGIDSYGKFPIYCTSLTKRLVCRRYPKLNPSIFKSLEIGEPKILGDADQGFTVTAYDANHCPGAIMLLFEGSFGNVLHTGDCRLSSECLNQLMDYVSGSGKVLDCVYLDCTFGREPLVLPSKEEAIEQVKKCIWNHPNEARVYFACNMLGQETLLEAIAKDFCVRIFIDKDRLSNYYADLEVIAPEFLTTDRESTRFEICDGCPKYSERARETMNQAKFEGRMQPLVIRPSTQWYVFEETLEGDGSGVINAPIVSSRCGGSKRRSATSSVTQATKDDNGVYHVCYSMHSSQIELKRAMKLLNPVEVISTTPLIGICDFEKSSQSPTTNSVTIVETVEQRVTEDRGFRKEKKNYSLSPLKATSSNNVDSPGKLIPLFGHAQYVLPPSPVFPSYVSKSSPPPLVSLSSPVPSDKLALTSQASSQGSTPSKNARAKRLFIEPGFEVETRSNESLSLSPSKTKNCTSQPMPSQINDPNMPSPIVIPSHYHRSVSMPVPVAPRERIDSHNVRSKSFSRLPTRRKFRIPEPLPSLLEMKRSGE